jgi:uncharacterized protein (DUF2235 family)
MELQISMEKMFTIFVFTTQRALTKPIILQNTNVVELYAYISKGKNQLKYYNSGIGTYARPTFRSIKYWGQVLDNKIDLLVAWWVSRS